jgi:hypothetical protein
MRPVLSAANRKKEERHVTSSSPQEFTKHLDAFVRLPSDNSAQDHRVHNDGLVLHGAAVPMSNPLRFALPLGQPAAMIRLGA